MRAEMEWRMRPLGASSFRGSYWASYSLTGTAAGDSALFLLPQNTTGAKGDERVDREPGKDRRGRVNKLGLQSL